MRLRRLMIASAGLIAAGVAAQERALAPIPRIVEPSFIDTTCSPCKDFFQFANGIWLARDTIPAEYTSWGVIGEAQERNEVQLRQLLEQAAARRTEGDANAQRLGTFYATCIDSAESERDGATPLGPELARTTSDGSSHAPTEWWSSSTSSWWSIRYA